MKLITLILFNIAIVFGTSAHAQEYFTGYELTCPKPGEKPNYTTHPILYTSEYKVDHINNRVFEKFSSGLSELKNCKVWNEENWECDFPPDHSGPLCSPGYYNCQSKIKMVNGLLEPNIYEVSQSNISKDHFQVSISKYQYYKYTSMSFLRGKEYLLDVCKRYMPFYKIRAKHNKI